MERMQRFTITLSRSEPDKPIPSFMLSAITGATIEVLAVDMRAATDFGRHIEEIFHTLVLDIVEVTPDDASGA